MKKIHIKQMSKGVGHSLLKLFTVAATCSIAVAAPATYTQSVTYQGETVTMQLKLQSLRGPNFEVLVQNSSGGYDVHTPVAERSYLGTVDEHSGAVSCGVLMDDGSFKGAIYFDRGATWFTLDSSVASTRALNYDADSFSSFAYPTSSTVRPGQAGTDMNRFDVGMDVDNDYFTVRGGGSLAKTLDLIEYSTNNVRAIYMRDCLLRPYLGRVIIRADKAQDPYDLLGGGSYLDAVRLEWNNNHTDADRDVVAAVTQHDVGGGLAWVGVIATSSAYSVNDSSADGSFDVIWRHEVGHNWGCSHFVGGSPEGTGLMGGNAAGRCSGCESHNIMAHRDSRSAGVIDNEGVYMGVELPPYASLDSAVFLRSRSTPLVIDVLANDFDSNAQTLSLSSFDSQSANGGSVSLQGQSLTYSAPAGFTGADHFKYVISDSAGKTATGVVVINVIDPINPVGVWTFDDSQNLTAATVGADLTLVGTDQSVAGIEGGDGAARIGLGSHYSCAHGIVANGGGTKVNEYSFVMDISYPASSSGLWKSLFQTNSANTDDGDCFISSSNATVGVNATGYSSYAMPADTWVRLAVVVDNDSSYSIYADGVLIMGGSVQALDGRFSLDPQVLMFGDESGDDAPLDVSAIRVYDVPLSAAYVASLGGVESVNQAPTISDGIDTIYQGVLVGTTVHAVSTSDPNAIDILSYAITDGNVGGVFSINSSGEIVTASALDYSVISQYVLTVTVTDDHGLSDTATVTIDVTQELELNPDGVWHFDTDYNNEVSGGSVASLIGSPAASFQTVTINGESAQVISLPALSSAQSIDLPNDVGGNGGGGRTNEWTMVMDVKIDYSSASIAGLIQTNPANSSSVDFFARSNGEIDTDFTAPLATGLTDGVWHRITIRRSAGGGNLVAFVDGVKGSGVDGYGTDDVDFTLPSVIRLFTDDSGETAPMLVNSIAYFGRTLSDTDILLLGSASAGGIGGATPPQNNAPSFASGTINGSAAAESQSYNDTISGSASDPDVGDSISYSVVSGPLWLSVNSDGSLSGTPGNSDVGNNQWTVRVTDNDGLTDDASLLITVDAAPVENDVYGSVAENTTAGTVTGSFSDTLSSDNSYEVLTEEQTGGKPSNKLSQLEHVWTFNVTSGQATTLRVEAHHTANSEGDNFVFSYSTDGSNYTDVLTVTKTSDDDVEQTSALPANLSGTVYIRVVDADRTKGNSVVDSLSVDLIAIEVTPLTGPPSAVVNPSPVNAATGTSLTPTLTWDATGGADSYDVYFGTSAPGTLQGNQTGTSFSPGTLTESTVYYWRVDSVNGNGTTTGSVWSFTTGAGAPSSLFTDDFEDGDVAGWAITGSVSADTGAANGGVYGAKLKNIASMTTAVDTSSASSVDLSYDRATTGLDSGESLTVEWSIDGSSWNSVESTSSSAWGTTNVTLPSGAAGQAALQIRFSLNANRKNETAYVDNVVVSGS